MLHEVPSPNRFSRVFFLLLKGQRSFKGTEEKEKKRGRPALEGV